jgi:hypothetical protein
LKRATLASSSDAPDVLKKKKSERVSSSVSGMNGTADEAPEKRKPKGRYTVALSEKSEKILEELRIFSDAETITEVIRDALRLSYAVMEAEKKGLRVELSDPKRPGTSVILTGVSRTIPA